MFCISAPGKQMIAGEWAVLELGNPCLVAAINNRVRAKIEESREAEILIEDFNLKVLADLKKRRLIFKNKLNKEEKNKLIFIKKAIETSLQYLEVEKPFKIKTWSETFQIEVNGEKKKVGFGSSAASVVATVGGLLKFDGKDIKKEETKDIIFKLSVISHYFAQGKLGSGFDIAASTYGGVILYKRFDDKWLTSEIKKGKRIKEIVEKKWKGLYLERLKIPKNLIFLVAYTGKEASTSALIKKMNIFKENHPEEYKRICEEIKKVVLKLVKAWKNEDQKKILESIRENGELLGELSKKSKIEIETPELKKLAQIANGYKAAGKLSGAGGGDCGIAICFDEGIAKKIKEKWKKNGLIVLDVNIDYEGVK